MKLTLGLTIITCLLTSCSKKNEKERDYFDNGRLEFEVTLINGKREGKSIRLYPDGSTFLESNWKRGAKHGQSIGYYRNGTIKQTEVYDRDVLNGLIKRYDSVGNIIEKVMMSNNLENGEYVKYYPDGSIKVEANFLSGKKHGKCQIYFPNGGTSSRLIYDNGVELYSIDFYKSGAVRASQFPVKITSSADEGKHKFGEEYTLTFRMDTAFFENTTIGLIVGTLDDTKTIVLDTIAMIDSPSSELRYQYMANKIGNNKIEGMFFEIVDGAIKGYMPVAYPYTVSPVHCTLQDNCTIQCSKFRTCQFESIRRRFHQKNTVSPNGLRCFFLFNTLYILVIGNYLETHQF